jgi:dTDP-4-dehydrorhamnose 3,5-epimerase
VIDGVQVKTLQVHPDERGHFAELFRADDGALPAFAQVHLTTLYPGVVKAWHRHRDRTDALCALAGTVRLGLFDGRPGSDTEGEVNEFFLGEHSPLRVTIPPGVWFGLKGIGVGEALVLVLTDRTTNPHVPDEERWDPEANDIPFDWDLRHR